MRGKEKIYFNGLNGLRFFAALAVIVTHVELLKGSFGFKNIWKEPLIFNLGGLGVYFFFVLSGFLITYLLLAEKELFGAINIRAFYIRRVLRIWPLYYLIVMLGFFILPLFPQINVSYLTESFEAHFAPNLLLFVLILPNLAFSIWSAVPHIGHLWSIGVEEQFYIFWPWLVRRSGNLKRSLVLVIVTMVMLKILTLMIGTWFPNEDWYLMLKRFLAMSKFECMAIGGLGAYYLRNTKGKLITLMQSRLALILLLTLIPVIVYLTPDFLQDGIHIVFSFLFLAIILNVLRNNSLLENKLVSYLGKISYGIYMYHFMIIAFMLYIFKTQGNDLPPVLFNFLLYASVMVSTVVISALSYEFFEKPFINLKKKFTLVQSGTKSN